MKIALPTNDCASLSIHFSRSAGFQVFDVENGQIRASQFRPNSMQHDRGQDEHGGHAGGHDHNVFVNTPADCSTVICGGIGGRAAAALQAGGLQIVVTTEPGALDAIVFAWLAGALPVATPGFCACKRWGRAIYGRRALTLRGRCAASRSVASRLPSLRGDSNLQHNKPCL